MENKLAVCGAFLEVSVITLDSVAKSWCRDNKEYTWWHLTYMAFAQYETKEITCHIISGENLEENEVTD